jgi:hypothetical protein
LPADTKHDAVYPDAEVTFVKGRVASISVFASKVRTLRGVRVGDRLRAVRRRYSVVCWPPQILGDIGSVDARCETAGNGSHLYFGGDPISVLVISTEPFRDGPLSRAVRG